MPTAPTLTNGSIGQSVAVDLSWAGGDLDGDAVTYDVYFEAGDTTPYLLFSDDQSGTTFNPGTLIPSTHYYWRIVAKDALGETTPGPARRRLPALSRAKHLPTRIPHRASKSAARSLGFSHRQAGSWQISRSCSSSSSWLCSASRHKG